jgi:Peptidase M15
VGIVSAEILGGSMAKSYRKVITRTEVPSKSKRDVWDKLAILSVPFASALIGGVGVWVTNSFNAASLEQQEIQTTAEREQRAADAQADRLQRAQQANDVRLISEAQQLEKLFAFVSSTDPQKREFGYQMFQALGREELAIRLIRIKDDRAGGIVFLKRLQRSPDAATRKSAGEAIDSLREVAERSDFAKSRGIDNSMSPEYLEAFRLLNTSIIAPIESHFRKKVNIMSAFRSVALNKATGGRIATQHSKGEAVDITLDGIAVESLACWVAENLEFDQLILEPQPFGSFRPKPVSLHISYVSKGNRKRMLNMKCEGLPSGSESNLNP